MRRAIVAIAHHHGCWLRLALSASKASQKRRARSADSLRGRLTTGPMVIQPRRRDQPTRHCSTRPGAVDRLEIVADIWAARRIGEPDRDMRWRRRLDPSPADTCGACPCGPTGQSPGSLGCTTMRDPSTVSQTPLRHERLAYRAVPLSLKSNRFHSERLFSFESPPARHQALSLRRYAFRLCPTAESLNCISVGNFNAV